MSTLASGPSHQVSDVMARFVLRHDERGRLHEEFGLGMAVRATLEHEEETDDEEDQTERRQAEDAEPGLEMGADREEDPETGEDEQANPGQDDVAGRRRHVLGERLRSTRLPRPGGR